MSSDTSIRDDESASQPAGLGLPEILYVLFRRKWLVLTGVVFGVVAALGLWKVKQPLFQSEAKLLVKYVIETRSLVVGGSESQVRAPDSSGANIINSEVQILSSLDIARQVAGAITPEKILPGARDMVGDSAALTSMAAGSILGGLRVDVPNNGWIISLRFEHQDPVIAQQVLEQLIASYLTKHREIHRASGTLDDGFVQQREQLRSQLTLTEEQLKQVKAKAGVVSVEEAKKSQALQRSIIVQDLRNAEAELALRSAALEELQKSKPTNMPVTTAVAATPADKASEYRRVCADVEELDRRERILLLGFTLDYPQAKTNHLQLTEARRRKSALEKEYPELLLMPVTSPSGVPTPAIGLAGDAITQNNQIVGLKAKIQFLTNQLAAVREEGRMIEEHESEITALERKRAFLENQLSYVERNLQQAIFDQELASGKTANISRIQDPSPPFRDFKALYKKMAMALLGGLGGGIGLAFLWEMFVNRTVKRPTDVEKVLDVPLFLSIPALKSRSLLRSHVKHSGLTASTTGPVSRPSARNGGLQPFSEALRDRLVNYFEIRDMTHKPKMIAVTSCAEGAGVSSIASGLAASLSETGDGNVLLVDMRGERGAAHAFCQGKPACGLDQALESDTRDNALVDQNLYVVSTDSVDRDLQRIIPKRFSHLVPKLKASDYDYIIFDMPPVAQTSITSKVARFMDMVLMVIEADKTDREVVKRAGELLAETKATVATILNKQRRYVPAWLQQEFH